MPLELGVASPAMISGPLRRTQITTRRASQGRPLTSTITRRCACPTSAARSASRFEAPSNSPCCSCSHPTPRAPYLAEGSASYRCRSAPSDFAAETARPLRAACADSAARAANRTRTAIHFIAALFSHPIIRVYNQPHKTTTSPLLKVEVRFLVTRHEWDSRRCDERNSSKTERPSQNLVGCGQFVELWAGHRGALMRILKRRGSESRSKRKKVLEFAAAQY